jgi:hypothetical protein
MYKELMEITKAMVASATAISSAVILLSPQVKVVPLADAWLVANSPGRPRSAVQA